jgi:hypothetical protein
MIIVLTSFFALVVILHRFVMKSIDNYDYGQHTLREWRDFEKRHHEANW